MKKQAIWVNQIRCGLFSAPVVMMRTLFMRLIAFLLLFSIIGENVSQLCGHSLSVVSEKLADMGEKDAKEDNKSGEDDCKSQKDKNKFASAEFALAWAALSAKRIFPDVGTVASLTFLATFTPPPERLAI